MLYRIAHILRDRFPFIWELIGWINSLLFGLRYKNKLIAVSQITKLYKKDGFHINPLTQENATLLAKMFAEQPKESFDYFKPHEFNVKTLRKLATDKSFLAYIVCNDEGRPVGYFFMRSFFWGKCFRGYFTDYRWRRRGINKQMNLCATAIATKLGLRSFGTIAPDNIASLKSAESANQVKVIEILDNGDYFVEYLPK